MAAHDASWDIFRSELKHWMELRRYTNKALADAINADADDAGLSAPITEQIIKRWRHSTSPPLQSLKVIGRILGMSNDPAGNAPYDPTYLPRAMGILEAAPEHSELIEAAYRLQSIRAKITDAQSTLASATADEGVVNIVRRAMESGLGAAVLPVFEGPRGYPMHVSDRIDLREPQPDRPAPKPIDHPGLADALQDSFAVVSRRTPRFAVAADAAPPVTLSPWAVQYVGRPRPGIVHRPHDGVPAVVVTSVTTTPWTDDVGALVAMVLGYGFTTTRELARELVKDPYRSDHLRNDIHDNFLSAATPTRRVWSHHGSILSGDNPYAPFRDAQGRVTNQLVQICLVEDDASLLHTAQFPPGRLGGGRPVDEVSSEFDELRRQRDTMVARAEELTGNVRVFSLPVTFSPEPDERWLQVFRCTLAVLQIIAGLGIDGDLRDVHDRLVRSDPQVAPQVLRWLADHDAPFVDPRYRTRR